MKKTREQNRRDVQHWREKHRDQYNAYMRTFWATHPESKEKAHARNSVYHEQWYAANQESKRAKTEAYRQANKWRWAADRANRRALEIMAMPRWVDPRDIVAFYNTARRLSIETGIPHEVDHIWPLQGDGFVGLHVPWNLRVVPQLVNRKKLNRRPR